MTRGKNDTPAPDDLTRAQRIAIVDWIKSKPHLKHLAANRKMIRFHVDECLAHHRSKGNEFTNWVAACQKWITKGERWRIEKIQDERPQQTGPRSSGFTPLSDTIRVLEGGKK